LETDALPTELNSCACAGHTGAATGNQEAEKPRHKKSAAEI
jgi:hypothetical protein